MNHYGYLAEDGSAAAPASEAASDGEDGAEGAADPGAAANFQSHDGKFYGLARAKSVNIVRLGGTRDNRSLRHVLVVTVSPHPDDGRHLVVGWQTESWVTHTRNTRPDGREYNYQGALSNAVLLPLEQRTYEIAKGREGMGQSMMTYGNDAKGAVRPWLKGLIEYIRAYDGPNIIEL